MSIATRARPRRLHPQTARGWLRKLSPFTVVSCLIVAGLLFVALYPLVRMVGGLFWSNGHLSVAPFKAAAALPDFSSLIWQTVVVVVAASVVALVIGSVLAWLNERTNARLGLITDAMPMVPFLLPPIAGAIGWVLLLAPTAGYVNVAIRSVLGVFGLHLDTGPLDIYTWYGLVFVYVIYQVPYVFLLVSAGLRNVDGSMEEQSRICGVGPLRTMWRVTLPAVRPSLGAALVLLFWNGFGLFSVPAIIGPGAHIDILAVKIVNLLTFTFPPDIEAALGLSVIVVAFVGSAWYVQSRISRMGRHASVGGKSVPSRRISLGRWRWPVRGIMFGYLMIGTVLPIIGLVLVSLNGFWTPHIRWSHLSLKSLRMSVFEDPTTVMALKDSLILGAGGATLGILLASIVSLFMLRHTSLPARMADGVVKMPAAVSHIVVGVAFILAFAGAPFDLGGTLLILLVAYIVLWMPQGLVTTDAAVRGVGTELVEASQISGVGTMRTIRRVYAPLMVSSLATGWALLFVRMAGDLTASSLLAGTSNPVVGFRILNIFENGSYAALASLSLVLVVITGIVVITMMTLARRRVRVGFIHQP